MTTSSITAALPGTVSSTSGGQSCRSACAIGHIGPDQRGLVLEENTLASHNSVKMHNACVNDDRQNQTDRNDDRWDKPGIHVYFLPSYFWVRHAIISPPPEGPTQRREIGPFRRCSVCVDAGTFRDLTICRSEEVYADRGMLEVDPVTNVPRANLPLFNSSFSLVASRATPKIPPTGNVITHSSEFGITIILSPKTADAFQSGWSLPSKGQEAIGEEADDQGYQ
jgi:hypothetical protein